MVAPFPHRRDGVVRDYFPYQFLSCSSFYHRLCGLQIIHRHRRIYLSSNNNNNVMKQRQAQ
jgi:hypothetical protein